jgi:hypothetical protein
MVHKRVAKIYEQVTAPNGVQFKIVQAGLVWRLFVKELGSKHWNEIQGAVDAKVLHQVMMNQKEFR